MTKQLVRATEIEKILRKLFCGILLREAAVIRILHDKWGEAQWPP
jgi:hypothetical protein